MAASGAARRVVRALRPFMLGCPSLSTAVKAKHAAIDSVLESALELGDIAPAYSNLTPEQQEQGAEDAIEAGRVDGEYQQDPGQLELDETTREDAPDEGTDELGSARATTGGYHTPLLSPPLPCGLSVSPYHTLLMPLTPLTHLRCFNLHWCAPIGIINRIHAGAHHVPDGAAYP